MIKSLWWNKTKIFRRSTIFFTFFAVFMFCQFTHFKAATCFTSLIDSAGNAMPFFSSLTNSRSCMSNMKSLLLHQFLCFTDEKSATNVSFRHDRAVIFCHQMWQIYSGLMMSAVWTLYMYFCFYLCPFQHNRFVAAELPKQHKLTSSLLMLCASVNEYVDVVTHFLNKYIRHLLLSLLLSSLTPSLQFSS